MYLHKLVNFIKDITIHIKFNINSIFSSTNKS